MTLSLRSRVALLAVLLVLVALGTAGIATLGVTRLEVDRFMIESAGEVHRGRLARATAVIDAAPVVAGEAGRPLGPLPDALVGALEAEGIPAAVLVDGRVAAASQPVLAGGRTRELPDGGTEIRAEGVLLVLKGATLPVPGVPAQRVLLLPDASAPALAGNDLVAPIRRGVLWALLATAAAGALLAFALARRLTGPLEELTAAVRRVAAGDLSVRVAARGRDEVGTLAEAFNGLTHRLERAEQARRAMVSDVAHELRAPLTTLRCDLEAVQDGLRPLDRAQVDVLHRELLALGCLVDDLQELALADAGQLRLDPRPCELGALLGELAEAHTAHAAKRGVRLRVEADAAARVSADPWRLGQALRNLLDNALVHAPAGSEVTLRLVPGGSRHILEVVDRGPGIPPEDRERIFERFCRLDPSRTRATGGSGLGLAIARAWVEAHGGAVAARETPGGGATFRLELPAISG